MSRKSALMTEVACIVVESPQSTTTLHSVTPDENASCNQAPLPDPLVPQHKNVTNRAPRVLSRNQKRKAYYYNNLQKNSNHHTQSTNKGKKLGQRRSVHHEVQPRRPGEGPGDSVRSRSTHAQSSFSANPPSQRPSGPLYTGQIAQITNNYYYMTPDQVGSSAVPPLSAEQTHVPWGRPVAATTVRAPHTLVEMQEARQLTAAIGMSFGENDSHGPVKGSHAELCPRPQAQPFPQPVTALSQQQGFGAIPRQRSMLSSSPVHRHVGINILPGSIKRTQTLPIRCLPDCSRSI